MAQVDPGSGGKYHLPRPRLDMTPMVDLGFLLITFFIFTASLAENKGMKFYMPADGPPINIGESTVLTFLLAPNNQMQWFEGDCKEEKNTLHTTGYANVGNIIRDKQRRLGKNRNELMLLIKAGDESHYGNVMDMLDEVLINDVKKYALLDWDGTGACK